MSEGLGYAGGDNSPLRGRSKLSFKSLFDCALGNIMKSSEGSQAVIVIIIKLIIIFKKLLKEGGHVGGGCRVPAFISGPSVNATGMSHAMVTIFIIVLLTMTMTMTMTLTMTMTI